MQSFLSPSINDHWFHVRDRFQSSWLSSKQSSQTPIHRSSTRNFSVCEGSELVFLPCLAELRNPWKGWYSPTMMRFVSAVNNESREVGKNPQVDVWRYHVYIDIYVHVYFYQPISDMVSERKSWSLLNSFTLSKDDSNSPAMQSKAKIIWSRPCWAVGTPSLVQLQHSPYHLCMVYLPTFGWCWWQM